MSSIIRKLRPGRDKEKTIFRMRNGESFLREIIAASDGKYNPFRNFSAEELNIATNNYDQRNLMKTDGFYELYKGFWLERPISVMWSASRIETDLQRRSINNVVYASQMRHKNILKLIGCCLETEIPILVFESIEHDTLYDLINSRHQALSGLTRRLKIAMDIANAVAYLHLGFPRPIIFLNIMSSNILFNEENACKLFDFSLSKSIPEGETHVELDTWVGKSGYTPPEFLDTSKCNEKSDVYSFGVVLFELITGLTVYGSSRGDRCLRPYVKSFFENNRSIEMVDPVVVEDRPFPGKEQILKAFLQLAFKCVNESPEERPTMVEVAKQLRQMHRSVVESLNSSHT